MRQQETKIYESEMIEFEGVVPALAQALHKRGYSSLTPVQQAVLSPDVENADILVSAQTGSGKTVAFGLTLAPMLLDGAQKMERATAPLVLVVTPTRELALQVKRELSWLYEATGAALASCVGGMDMRDERRALSRGAHIVVGTPGRLKDHIMRRSLDMSALKAVVLDEADEMLDLGFREDLEFILDAMPEKRRTLMFSATVSASIANLAKKYQHNAQRINTQSEQKQHLDIAYRALGVAQKDQENAIVNVLRYYEAKNALIFCGTRAMVNHMTARFNNRGFSVVALSGELSQSERTHALQAMRDGRAKVCIATDVAARGIDLPNLELVIHAEIPKNRESLLHRSGRTGRAGRKGTSVLIVPANARRYTERLLKSANIDATWALPPSMQEVLERDDQRILEDPALSEPVSESEMEFVRQLLERHEPEQIGAALVRLFRSGKSAPEELLDPGPAPSAGNSRAMMAGGKWFSLSVGRKHNAEPRWLIPLLCTSGELSKRNIGNIAIQQNETYIELDPKSVPGFLAAIGPEHMLENSIRVKALERPPEQVREARERSFAKKNNKNNKKKKFGGAKPFAGKPFAGKKPKAKKPFKARRDKKPL